MQLSGGGRQWTAEGVRVGWTVHMVVMRPHAAADGRCLHGVYSTRSVGPRDLFGVEYDCAQATSNTKEMPKSDSDGSSEQQQQHQQQQQ